MEHQTILRLAELAFNYPQAPTKHLAEDAQNEAARLAPTTAIFEVWTSLCELLTNEEIETVWQAADWLEKRVGMFPPVHAW